MNIVVTGTRGFPGIQGGVENHCEKLYTHLINLGCHVTVFTRKPYNKSGNGKYKGITLIPINCPRNKFLEAIVHTTSSIFKARKLQPDIVHIHAIGPSLLAVIARVLGMKVVVTNHGHDYERKKWPLPAKYFLKFCERMGSLSANKIIAIAPYIADNIWKNYGRDSTVIPNGVELPALADSDEILKDLGLVRRQYILAVGRFVPEKGFDDLMDAFGKLKLANWKLVIAGDADHEDEYSRNIKIKAKNNTNIILAGFVTGQSLSELYSHAGLFVIPSYHEGLPIVLLEAMSYGLSCIASNISANKNVELSDDRFFEVGDIESLSSKMIEYINKSWNDEDRERQVTLIAEKYNWEKLAAETFKLYEKLIF